MNSFKEPSVALWEINEFTAALAGRLVYKKASNRETQTNQHANPPDKILGVSIDSRTICFGEAYCAIRGKTQDGHAFLQDAFQNGAMIAVVAENNEHTLPCGYHYVVVPNVMESLRNLARAARRRFNGIVIAVTGSVGKTSTKEMMGVVLSAYGKVHTSVNSFNNHIGVPLSLARLPQNANYCVLEVGMDRHGEIEALTSIIKPHIALVISIAPAHIENFKNTTDIAIAKSEIWSHLTAINGTAGIAIVNCDLTETHTLLAAAETAKAKILTFGEAPEATVRLVQIQHEDISGSTIVAEFANTEQKFTYHIGAPGKHIAVNSLSVLATLISIGLNPTQSMNNFSLVRQIDGRGKLARIKLPKNSSNPKHSRDQEILLIDESYNANPSSMRAALTLLHQLGRPPGRRIAVLGDMAALGKFSKAFHENLICDIKAYRIDKVILVGPLMEALWKKLPTSIRGVYARTAASLKPYIFQLISANDTVMVKGANYMHMHMLVDELQKYATSCNNQTGLEV